MESIFDIELAILQMIVGGMTEKEIAFALDLSEEQFKLKVKSLISKLNVEDAHSAAVLAVASGLINVKLDEDQQ